jgi:hypothetical protein
MRYKVDMCRISTAFTTFEVEADTLVDAEIKAYQLAGDHVYKEKDAAYEIHDIRKASHSK